jgi:hypothetical protein
VKNQSKSNYSDFVDKFKNKKTTDDCYTPKLVYKEILGWVKEEYNIDTTKVVRPFYPGGDYRHYSYGNNAIVVDNPPFSILSEIVNFYLDRKIPFFLFAPALTLFSPASNQFEQFCHIGTNVAITYENGAKIATSFLTNLDESVVRTAPTLRKLIAKANVEKAKRKLPRYKYPVNVVRASDLGKLSEHGVDYKLIGNQVKFIRQLDSQKSVKKTIFGGGILTSKPPVIPAKEVITWKLSEQEHKIVSELN